MIAIVLAGGYAKRLWPLTLDRPKALLPIAGRSAIDYVVGKLISLGPRLNRIVVSTNLKFQSQFQDWLEASQHQDIELIPDELLKEGEKSGAVRAIAEIVRTVGEQEMLIVPGDNLFTDDLRGFLRFFAERHAPTIALYHAESVDETRKGSNVAVDEDGRVFEFVEKPVHPKTTLVGAAIYAFPAGIRRRFRQYLGLGLNVDEPGRFVEWLHRQEPVYGYMFKDYVWDIGTLDSYRAADEFFSKEEV
jgi:glucose-1-phosphate thymidylyltransferase